MNRDAIDFENGQVKHLFRQILLPTLLGSLSISAVTAIDGIFIGHGVGSDGVAAVNIVVPIYQLFSGLGLMIGVGCSVVASILLGQQKTKAARLHVAQALAFSSVLTFLICIFMWLWPEHTGLALGSSPTLLPQVVDYLLWILPCFVLQMWSFIGLFIIRLDGSPTVAMWCDVIPALLNALLDWVFIFPLGMGVKGAAIATSFSIMVGGLMAMGYLLFFSKTLRPLLPKRSRKGLLLTLRNIGYQCRIGSSTLLGEMTLAILIFVGNLIFMHYLGDDGVGAFGIACYYTPFFFMLGNSIAQSAQPIISYDYGTSRWERIRQARRLTFLTSGFIGVSVTCCFIFFPNELVTLFVDPQSPAGQIAVSGFPYFATGVIFYILNVAIAGYYQSIERIRPATWIIVFRGVLFLIPSFILLPRWWGDAGIWLAMPMAEALTFVAILFFKKVR